VTEKRAGAPEGLEALNRRVARELELLTLPAAPWVPESSVAGEPVLDVAIIGAGMAGLAAAAAFSSGSLILTLAGLTILSIAGPFIAVAASGLALATPANRRGVVSGTFLFCYNIVGFGAGPTVVASLSQWLAPEGGNLGAALTLSFVGTTPIIVLLFYLGLKPMRSAVEATAAAEAAAELEDDGIR